MCLLEGMIFNDDVGVNAIERITVTSQGQQTSGNVTGAAMSGDGRYVVFASGANNIVNGDLNAREDIFLRDRELGTTVLASVTPAGGFPDDHSLHLLPNRPTGQAIYYLPQALPGQVPQRAAPWTLVADSWCVADQCCRPHPYA